MATQQSILRISKEVTDIQKGPDLSLAVAFKDSDVRKVRALIIGPPETPYEFGFFEFSIKFPKEYPSKAPTVRALTTSLGQTRFNPNIYADGKICLSILGTWRGESGEQWSTAQGLESILISIQSLMSSNPYENEPGYENATKDHHKTDAKLYCAKIRHETLRIAVVSRLENWLQIEGPLRKEGESETPKPRDIHEANNEANREDDDPWSPFEDLCKRRFLWYYHTYLHSIDEHIAEHGSKVKDGASFKRMPFEGPSNMMDGAFHYTLLKHRLERIKKALDAETAQWEADGIEALLSESPRAFFLQNRFNHIVDDFNKNSDVPIDFELVNKNPFVWRLILFGRPMTNLDGGIFKVKMVIPATFPEEQPRVTVETPLFHQRVSPDGTLCYLPRRAHEIDSHVESIIEAIELESPPYDPRTLVNNEAAKLLWGSPEEKKAYNRKLRRSVQESIEH